MKYHVPLLLTVILSSIGWTTDPLVMQIERKGKDIQLDGFLIEWQQKNARQLPGASMEGPAVKWDASLTPSGIAGYFRTPFSNDSCEQVYMELIYPDSAGYDTLALRFDTTATNPYYVTHRTKIGSTRAVITEWLIPRYEASHIQKSLYAIAVNAYTLCGDTLVKHALLKEALPQSESEPPAGSNLTLRLFLILLLLGAYLLLRRYNRKNQQKRSSKMIAEKKRYDPDLN